MLIIDIIAKASTLLNQKPSPASRETLGWVMYPLKTLVISHDQLSINLLDRLNSH